MDVVKKQRIWYSRTYRTLKPHYAFALLFLLILVVPLFVIFITHLQEISGLMSQLAQKLISEELTGQTFTVVGSEYPPFGAISILSYDTHIPPPDMILWNLLLVIGILFILVLSSIRGRPLVVFLMFSFMVHIISCVFFAFDRNTIIYTGTDFSDLLMKQQIGVWMLFILLTGLVISLYTGRGALQKILFFFAVMGWSGLIGVIRYIVFNYLLARFSALYIADMYFVAGPVFDFLYLVCFFSFYSHQMQKIFESPNGENEWKWL